MVWLALTVGEGSPCWGGVVRLPSFVGLEGAVRLAPGEDAPLQGTSNVFAIDGQRSIVAAAMF